MKKEKARYLCDNCGHEEPKWAGRCPACFSWNSFSEIKLSPSGAKAALRRGETGTEKLHMPVTLKEMGVGSHSQQMHDSGIGEINRVLGGGITPGSAVIIGGEPGIGKSTIMMQLAGSLSAEKKVLYISGEESAAQMKMRAERLAVDEKGSLSFFFSPVLEHVTSSIHEAKPDSVIIDSIQTLFSPEAGTTAGTVNQLKYCCQELIDTAKHAGISLFLVAHVTKEGIIAGPRTIEHMVDTVLYFEHSENEMRILRAVKNRFGPVDELGLFRMGTKGLSEVKSPESAFLVARSEKNLPGICVAAVHEGSRIFLVEVQALTVPAKGGLSRVFSDRIDSSRISRIAAVLEKHTSLKFSDQDIYINVAGGMKIREVGVDLPAALALYSARTGIPVPPGTAAAGELSLTGEIRPVPFTAKRIKSASSYGILEFYSSSSDKEKGKNEGTSNTADNISQVIKSVFTSGKGKTGKS